MTQTHSNGTCVIQNCLTLWVHPNGLGWQGYDTRNDTVDSFRGCRSKNISQGVGVFVRWDP